MSNTIDMRDKQAEVHLTYHCNLSCISCNRASFYRRKWIPEMTSPRFQQIMDDIDRLGLKRKIVLLGGEPTLHPQFIEFTRRALARKFDVEIFSNGFTESCMATLEAVSQEGARVNWATLKQEGSDHHLACQTVFCASIDIPGAQRASCVWRNSTNCGYCADELGYAPCPIGGMIAYWQCSEVYTRNLDDLLRDEYMDWALNRLCQYCGAFLDRGAIEESGKVQKVRGTLMSDTWLRIFGV